MLASIQIHIITINLDKVELSTNKISANKLFKLNLRSLTTSSVCLCFTLECKVVLKYLSPLIINVSTFSSVRSSAHSQMGKITLSSSQEKIVLDGGSIGQFERCLNVSCLYFLFLDVFPAPIWLSFQFVLVLHIINSGFFKCAMCLMSIHFR